MSAPTSQPKSQGAKYTVFISHASSDLFIARAIHKEIKALGVDTWLDDNNLEGGANWWTTC